MLTSMIEAWALWLVIVGVAAGGVITWLVMVRLPRSEDDVNAAERPAEAAWISRVIERHGGVAPASLVEEVLDLHQAYLSDPRLAQPPMPTWTPAGPPHQAPASYPGVPPVWPPPGAAAAAPDRYPPGGSTPPSGWTAPPGPPSPPGGPAWAGTPPPGGPGMTGTDR